MKDLRRRIWVDPFQYGLLIRIVVYCLIYQVISWAFFVCCEQTDFAFKALTGTSTFLGSAMARNVLTLLILVPPLTIDAIRFAHRLVGPLCRFHTTVKAIAAGEPVRLVTLRKNDMLVEFQHDFNAMLEHLQRQGYVLIKTAEPADDARTLPTVGRVASAVDQPPALRPRGTREERSADALIRGKA